MLFLHAASHALAKTAAGVRAGAVHQDLEWDANEFSAGSIGD